MGGLPLPQAPIGDGGPTLRDRRFRFRRHDPIEAIDAYWAKTCRRTGTTRSYEHARAVLFVVARCVCIASDGCDCRERQHDIDRGLDA